MASLDPRIEAVRQQYGLSREDFWEIPQKPGTWVAKHAALEVAAVKANIMFDLPVIIEHDANGLITSMVVQGVMGERREWATGETNPSNYRVTGKQPSYPWAMSEKRAKDRVILKLIGIHGLVYSDAEGDFGDATLPKAKTRDLFAEMRDELDACQTMGDLATLWNSPAFKTEFAKLKPDWKELLTQHKDGLKEGFSSHARTTVPPNFDTEPA